MANWSQNIDHEAPRFTSIIFLAVALPQVTLTTKLYPLKSPVRIPSPDTAQDHIWLRPGHKRTISYVPAWCRGPCQLASKRSRLINFL